MNWKRFCNTSRPSSTAARQNNNHSCAIRLYGRFQEVQTLMNEINRAAYITALQGLLVAATDAQLDTLWCMATKMILEQEKCEE